VRQQADIHRHRYGLRLRLRGREGLLDGLEPAVGEAAHADLGPADLADQLEGAVVIIDDAHGGGRQEPHVEHADGVAVGLGVLDLARTRGAASGRVVHDDDRLRQQLLFLDRGLQQPGHHVGLPAGCDRHDHAYRLFRIAGAHGAPTRKRKRAGRCGEPQGVAPGDPGHEISSRGSISSRPFPGSFQTILLCASSERMAR
jgi:hypothetical protein